MPAGYIPLAVMLATAAVLSVVMVVGSYVLGPKKPGRYKDSPYECGMTPVGTARERFPIRFYLIAMLFIIFDIETVFLYPWAATFRQGSREMKIFNLAEMAVFVGILFVGYFYILGKGVLQWDDASHAPNPDAAADPSVKQVRRPIVFGNENSGPVNLARVTEEQPR